MYLDPNTLEKLKRATCPICETECIEVSVSCEICHQWFHAGCIKMSTTVYNAISGKSQIGWFCIHCTEKKGKWAPTNNEQASQMAILMERTAKVCDKIDQMEKTFITKDHLRDFEKKIEDMVDSKINDSLEERIEKERRRLNLLIVNAEESTGDKEERMERDLQKVKDILKEILPEDEAKQIKVSNPVRLGATNAGTKPRMLRIEVESEEVKWKIIKNAYKLNEGLDWSDPNKRYINLDYTRKERERNQKLREELKRRRMAGEKNIRIKGDQIVTFVPNQA